MTLFPNDIQRKCISPNYFIEDDIPFMQFFWLFATFAFYVNSRISCSCDLCAGKDARETIKICWREARLPLEEIQQLQLDNPDFGVAA